MHRHERLARLEGRAARYLRLAQDAADNNWRCQITRDLRKAAVARAKADALRIAEATHKETRP